MKYRTIPSDTNIYFVSSVVTGHLPLFTLDEIAFIPLTSLRWMWEKNIWKLYVFCLMPNHLHLLVRILDGRPIEKIMEQFHSFTGHELAKCLEKVDRTNLLPRLREAGRKKGDRELLIWEDCLAKCVEQENVLLESIEYIHNNPCNKKWKLVLDRADYRYSSAIYYDQGGSPIIEIDDYRELLGETPSR